MSFIFFNPNFRVPMNLANALTFMPTNVETPDAP